MSEWCWWSAASITISLVQTGHRVPGTLCRSVRGKLSACTLKVLEYCTRVPRCTHLVHIRTSIVKNCDLSSLMMGTWFVLSFCQGQNNVYVIKTPSYDMSTELLYPSHDMAMFLWAPKIHVCLVRTYTSLESNTSQQEAVWIWPTQNFWLLVSSVH